MTLPAERMGQNHPNRTPSSRLDPGVHVLIGDHRDRSPGGFTLIELVVVLALIGLSLGVVMPLLGKGVPGTALTAATSEIRAALRTARSTAIAEDRKVLFHADSTGYWLDRRHFSLPAANGLDPPRIRGEGGTRIAFFPSGGSSGGRILVGDGSGRREIAVDAISGRADVR
jgi:general secretion pathway protein H